MKIILVVWLINPSNFAEYDSFKTLNACVEKLQTVKKALKQAESTMVAECWIVEPKKISI